ncbi:Trp biosynthesis-associated membrane protein [Nocardioides sp. URHA0020]|uniref:Trp biosynthesis-associated membrane protein n=1 Tax=Nocardioides sp. URHA0020 TaxID=1380392 RepID=UPI0006882B09|nr:Trp biosynthesis-associated membrane protein [Nocardioides sp. URHA0020]
MAESRRRTFGPVVLLGLAAGTLTAVAGEKPAVTGSGAAARAVSSRLVSFDAHLPLVTALGLVVLACWGVVLVTRGRVRRAVAVLATIAALGALVAALAAYSQVPDQFRDELALVAVTDPDLSHTAWYWAAVVGAVLSTVAGALAVAWVPDWPEMGSRYDAPGSAAPAPVAPPEEQSSLELWKALDEGRDPTA